MSQDKVETMFAFPNSIEVRGADSKPTNVSPQLWSSEFVQYMVAYAWDVRMQRCTASAKDKAKAQKAMFASMKQGEIPTGGGGRGPSLSIEDEALLRYFNKGLKAADKVKSGDFNKRLLQEIRQELVKAMVAKGLDKEAIAAKLPTAIETNREVIETAIRARPAVAILVEAVRTEREGKEKTEEIVSGLSF